MTSSFFYDSLQSNNCPVLNKFLARRNNFKAVTSSAEPRHKLMVMRRKHKLPPSPDFSQNYELRRLSEDLDESDSPRDPLLPLFEPEPLLPDVFLLSLSSPECDPF